MDELLQELQRISINANHAQQPTDMMVGTVTKTNPLEIVTETSQAPLRESVLHLTSAVIEKKITAFGHSHVIHDTYTGGGTAEPALASVICYEDGKPLPSDGGYITLNRGLEPGDKVLLLRVQHGQQFIVLSRVFGGD